MHTTNTPYCIKHPCGRLDGLPILAQHRFPDMQFLPRKTGAPRLHLLRRRSERRTHARSSQMGQPISTFFLNLNNFFFLNLNKNLNKFEIKKKSQNIYKFEF
jgi:hypothetical protein